MANTYITSGTKFRPYTFAEMLQPVQLYTEAYDEIEEGLTSLDIMSGDVSGKLTNSKDDLELVNKIKGFRTELSAALDSLYEEGLNSTNKRKLNALKTKYTNELEPINKAYEEFKTFQGYKDKLAFEHPEIIIESYGDSVSDFMYGKKPQVVSVNTDDLMNEAMNIAKTQAERTYRESDWISTAGGRFLERSIEVGLDDIDFNNAFALAMIDAPVTAQDLNMTEEEFIRLSNNAQLIKASINEVINTPSFKSLSPENQQKALNAVTKGVRIGFKYDKKVDTESDPMFKYSLDKSKEELKGSIIGSDYFMTPDKTKADIRKQFTHTLGDNIGQFDSAYDVYFKDGKLKSLEEVERDAAQKQSEDVGLPTVTGIGYSTPYTTRTSFNKDSYINKYKELKEAFIDLNINSDNYTKDAFMEALDKDVVGRERASITSNDAGFNLIQTSIEAGIGNMEDIQEIVGYAEEDGVRKYKTKSFKVKHLFEDDKLNILRVNMDYSTGEISFMAKTSKGVKEFILPAKALKHEKDAETLISMSGNVRDISKGYKTVYQIDPKTGRYVIDPETNAPVEIQIPLTEEQRVRELAEFYNRMNIMFGESFDYFGPRNVN